MTWIDGGEDTSLAVDQLLSRTPSDERREHTLKANSSAAKKKAIWAIDCCGIVFRRGKALPK